MDFNCFPYRNGNQVFLIFVHRNSKIILCFVRVCKNYLQKSPQKEKDCTLVFCFLPLQQLSNPTRATRYENDVKIRQLAVFHTDTRSMFSFKYLNQNCVNVQETIYWLKMLERLVKFRLLFLTLFPQQILQFSVIEAAFNPGCIRNCVSFLGDWKYQFQRGGKKSTILDFCCVALLGDEGKTNSYSSAKKMLKYP